MGTPEGEAIAVPDIGGGGGSRAPHGGDAGSAIPLLRTSNLYMTDGRGERRERELSPLCLIGQGSAALVYLVRCKLTGRLSALKVQRKAEHTVDRVQMEREVMVDARHRLVAPLYAAFQDRLYLYLNMEYCPGGSLDNFMRYFVKRNLTEDEARFYAAEIALGLEFLHSKGYVYRDLKAANVLVAASGHVKLTDFGIAERGKVKIETEDKSVSPPRPLPRVQSLPGLPKVPPAQGVVTQTPAGHQRRKTLAGKAPLSIDSSIGDMTGEDPTRPHKSCQKTSDLTKDVYEHGTGSAMQERNTEARQWDGRREDTGAQSAYVRRRQQHHGATGATPPRPPSISRRVREKLFRLHRASSSSGSSPEVCQAGERSSLTGSEDVAVVDGSRASHSGVIPPLSSRRHRVSGLPPLMPESAVPRDRSGSPSPSSAHKPAVRQTSVALSQASWIVLSGSPEYMAPEVLLRETQGSAVDWWGLGILTYELLFGRTPFAGNDGKTRHTYVNIMNEEAQFPGVGERREGDISPECQDFVRALLTKDPRGRAGSRGAYAVQSHPFFSGVDWTRILDEEAPLVPQRLAGAHSGCQAPVKNTSGWWWDVNEGIAAEQDCAETNFDADQEKWWPFDRFNWSEQPGEGSAQVATSAATGGVRKLASMLHEVPPAAFARHV